MRPFFSVIICTFNRAHLLPRALDSLLQQDEQDWEAVIVDDASTDDSPVVIQKYASQDRRIGSILHPKNVGTSQARNTGIKACKGLFVTFLDSDDEFRHDHLASRRQMLVENDHVRFIHGGTKVIGDPFVIDRHDSSKKVHIDDCVVGGTFVVRHDVFTDIGLFDAVDYADDSLFYERAGTKGIVIAKTDHPSYIYHRDTPDQSTSTYGT